MQSHKSLHCDHERHGLRILIFQDNFGVFVSACSVCSEEAAWIGSEDKARATHWLLNFWYSKDNSLYLGTNFVNCSFNCLTLSCAASNCSCNCFWLLTGVSGLLSCNPTENACFATSRPQTLSKTQTEDFCVFSLPYSRTRHTIIKSPRPIFNTTLKKFPINTNI